MEGYQPVSSAAGGGVLGTDDNILIEVVEPSSFVAAGDRLLVHLNSCYSTACPGDTRTETQRPRKGKLKNLRSKPGLISEISRSRE